MVEATRGEPGARIYERFVSVDGTVVYGYERCVDSAAAVAHLVASGDNQGEQRNYPREDSWCKREM